MSAEMEYQLQFFRPDGTYRRAVCGDYETVHAEYIRHRQRRRIVRTDKMHPLRPKFRCAVTRSQPTRTVWGVVEQYFAWARRVGLACVTVYRGKEWHAQGHGWHGEVRVVEVADILGPAPKGEVCE